MTAACSAGAASHEGVEWQAIEWQHAHQTVRRLQARIVKATQAGRGGTVQAWHRRLTHSWSGKALAVKRVTENPGKHTPGVDRVLGDTPAKKAAAGHTLRQHGDRPQPLRRVYMAKPNGKRRPLGLATMTDRAMQALYLLALEPIAETRAEPNSYGFRPDRSPADAIGHLHQGLSLPTGAEGIFEGDLGSCCDQLSHEGLLPHIPREKTIVQKWLKAGFMEKSVRHATEAGVPQGALCSPGLANLTLDGLEAQLRERYPKATARSRRAKVNLARFADDFVITGSSKELLELEVKPLVEQFWRERGLELSQKKTRLTPIKDGFAFLGHQVRAYNGQLLVKPSRKRVPTLLEKVRSLIKAKAQATTGNLSSQLNPLIRGGANYHRHGSSKQTFSKVDHAIFFALGHGAKRRHPHKPRRWIKETYFYALGGRHWVFCGERPGKDGPPQTVRLFAPSRVPIKRHAKIKGAANPFDPAGEVYFEHRLGVAMADDLKGRRNLRYVWREQGGLCPVCHQPITPLTGWHTHPRVWRTPGGADRATNRVLRHPNCHQQGHSHDWPVVTPRPSPDVRQA